MAVDVTKILPDKNWRNRLIQHSSSSGVESTMEISLISLSKLVNERCIFGSAKSTFYAFETSNYCKNLMLVQQSDNQ